MVHINFIAGLACVTLALALTPNNAGARSVGLADGSQFTTGGCTTDADCSSACCAGTPDIGICSAEAVATQNGKTGCGFVDPDADATIAAAEAQVAKQGFRRSSVKSSDC